MHEELIEYLPSPFRDMWWHHSYPLWPGWDGYVRGLRKPGGFVRQGRGPNAEDWLAFVDTNKIDFSVLYPTQGLTHGVYQDTEFAIALARAYNDYLYDRFTKVSPRLTGV